MARVDGGLYQSCIPLFGLVLSLASVTDAVCASHRKRL